jgi:hypothetical protein
MLFISCCMKSASNCFAVSRIAAFGSRAAAARSAWIDPLADASAAVVAVTPPPASDPAAIR